MTDLIDDPTTWFQGFVSAALIKLKLTDPMNQLAAKTSPIAMLLTRTATLNAAPLTAIPTANYTTALTVGDLTYNTGVITVGTTGAYNWTGTVAWPTPPSDCRITCYPLVNGAEPTSSPGRDDRIHLTSVGTLHQNAGGQVLLSAGDTIQMALYQTSSGYINGVVPKSFGLVRVA